MKRLRSVPFWQEVLHTEQRAGAIVKAFTETIDDPVVKDAVALQGFEEARHADLLRVMIKRYGIDAKEKPLEPLSPDIETAFKDFGYGECVDSFLGFGVFKIAQEAGFLPDSDIRDLRAADVRGDAPHRLLRQLDGLSRDAPGPCVGLAPRPDLLALLLPRVEAPGRHGAARRAGQ